MKYLVLKSDVDISQNNIQCIYNLPEYKFYRDRVVFYLSDVNIAWLTPNIYNLPSAVELNFLEGGALLMSTKS